MTGTLAPAVVALPAVLLWVAPVAVPVVAAVLAVLPGRRWWWLLPASALPALALALVAGIAPAPELPWVLLGARLGLDPAGRVLLVLTGLLWLFAGLCARSLVAERRGTRALWLTTLAGNVGLLVSDDVIGFYSAFALMTFAAYGLVVHSRSPSALRAGKVYVAFAVAGEGLLLSGLLLAVSAAEGLRLAEVAAGVAASPHTMLVTGLLAAGFAIKAGVVPLHAWLPLAHPAAPVPASAVLSGAMIKAGVAGWLWLLPLGEAALPSPAAVAIAVGLVSALGGAALGLTQHDPKVVLAYSSVSQMGLVAVVAGAGLAVAAGEVAVAAAAAFAVHHGLAKGTLFLGVGVVTRVGGRARWLALTGMGLPAAALAGLPFTSGAVAKSWAKDAVAVVADPWSEAWAEAVTLALSVSSVATTLLMARLLWLLARAPADGVADRGWIAAWVAALVGVAGVGWSAPALVLPELALPAVTIAWLWEGLWPVTLGAVLAGLAVAAARRGRLRAPSLPAGDVVVPLERLLRHAAYVRNARLAPRLAAIDTTRPAREVVGVVGTPGAGLDRVDAWLVRWRNAGAMFVAVTVVLVVVFVVVQ